MQDIIKLLTKEGKAGLRGTFHIAEWEIQPEINCVTRGDESHHLEPKVMQVLVQLASHPNQVLSKDQLIRTVWVDAFVSDDVLTRSISEIRRVLDDDARAPRFIQTIPKCGYRLIAPVLFHPPTPEVALSSPASAIESGHPVSRAENSVGTSPESRSRWFWALAVVLVLLAGSATLLLRKHPQGVSDSAYKTIPFTSNIGSESQPAFSPDGKQVAYVWDGGDGGFHHIYVKLVGTESQLKLTSGEANDYSPVWSPDGTTIAFLRQSSTDRGIYTVPSIGGPIRKLYATSAKIDVAVEWQRGALSWSPDGKRLIFPDGKSTNKRSSIHSLDLATLQVTRITDPPTDVDGDFSPVFSPDGSKIAFVRATEGFVRDIYVMDSTGSDPPERLTFDNRLVSGIAWSSDGQSIIFSSDRGGKYGLWRKWLKGGEPERLPVGSEDAFGPAVARVGDALVYTQRSAKWSILRFPAKNEKGMPTQLLASTQQDSAPQYSPDGTRIAFQSWRSGTQEIWICSSDGTDLVKLTSFGGPLTGSPSWSPDGREIAFDSRPKGHAHIYVMNVSSELPKAITDGDFNDILPTWSHDGRWVYFSSNRSGTWGIWKVPSQGGTPAQVSSAGGFLALESPDGKWIYYTKGDMPGIWRVPAQGGGAESMVVNEPAVGYWGYWTMMGDEIFYLDSSTATPSINAYNLKTRQKSRVHSLRRLPPPFAGITVSPDHKWLLYTDLSESGSHITLVEKFK